MPSYTSAPGGDVAVFQQTRGRQHPGLPTSQHPQPIPPTRQPVCVPILSEGSTLQL